MAKLDDMMGAMGAMGAADAEPSAPAKPEKKDSAGLSEEELMHAEDAGLTAEQGAAMKRFVKACVEGGYEDEEPPASQAEGDM